MLDEIIAEETEKDPEFPKLVEAAVKRRQLGRKLAEARKTRKLPSRRSQRRG